MQVLQTFDFDAVTISVICLEADGHSPAKDEAVVEFMKSKGYHYYGHIDRYNLSTALQSTEGSLYSASVVLLQWPNGSDG